jgi:hypothetical protein
VTIAKWITRLAANSFTQKEESSGSLVTNVQAAGLLWKRLTREKIFHESLVFY